MSTRTPTRTSLDGVRDPKGARLKDLETTGWSCCFLPRQPSRALRGSGRRSLSRVCGRPPDGSRTCNETDNMSARTINTPRLLWDAPAGCATARGVSSQPAPQGGSARMRLVCHDGTLRCVWGNAGSSHEETWGRSSSSWSDGDAGWWGLSHIAIGGEAETAAWGLRASHRLSRVELSMGMEGDTTGFAKNEVGRADAG